MQFDRVYTDYATITEILFLLVQNHCRDGMYFKRNAAGALEITEDPQFTDDVYYYGPGQTGPLSSQMEELARNSSNEKPKAYIITESEVITFELTPDAKIDLENGVCEYDTELGCNMWRTPIDVYNVY